MRRTALYVRKLGFPATIFIPAGNADTGVTSYGCCLLKYRLCLSEWQSRPSQRGPRTCHFATYMDERVCRTGEKEPLFHWKYSCATQ